MEGIESGRDGGVAASSWVSSEYRVALLHFLSVDDVESFHQAVRSHWSIENELHWRLYVTFREDASRIRRGNATYNLGGDSTCGDEPAQTRNIEDQCQEEADSGRFE